MPACRSCAVVNLVGRRPLGVKRWVQGHRCENTLAFPPQVRRRDEVVVNVDARHREIMP
jgi:hypothetical protein